jgi:hypothetical protein
MQMSSRKMIELKNIDPDDVTDVLLKVETSFGFKFSDDALKDVKTFGEICEIISNHIKEVDVNDCTTQQAFYKLRTAIAANQKVDVLNITPTTKLKDIFPRRTRRRQLKKVGDELNIPIDILDIKEGFGWTIVVGIVISLIMFFYKWQYALSGLISFIAVGLIANKLFAKELEIETVGQLAEKLSRENYLEVRRKPRTVNKKEVEEIVIDLFKNELGLEKEALTRQAALG